MCTCDSIRKTLVLNGAPRAYISVASNPEFLREGTAVTDFLYPDRIVIGCDDSFSSSLLREIYRPLTEGEYYRRAEAIPSPGPVPNGAQLIVTSARSAELIKHASNSFLAMKISFLNLVANVAETVGADIDQVCMGLGTDTRSDFASYAPESGTAERVSPRTLQPFMLSPLSAAWMPRCSPRWRGSTVNSSGGLYRKCVAPFGRCEENAWCSGLGLQRQHRRYSRVARHCDCSRVAEGRRESLCIRSSRNAECQEDSSAERAGVRRRPLPGSRRTRRPADSDRLGGFARLDLQKLRAVMRLPIILDGRNLYCPETLSAAGFQYHSVGRPATSDITTMTRRSHQSSSIVSHPALVSL